MKLLQITVQISFCRTAFTVQNGRETITPIPNRSVKIGQRQGLSTTDILRINKLYGCCEYDLLHPMVKHRISLRLLK